MCFGIIALSLVHDPCLRWPAFRNSMKSNNNALEVLDVTKDSAQELPEDVLRQLSKDLTFLLPSTGDIVERSALLRVRGFLGALLRTAGSSNLSLTHGAAALNALCGFLDQCQTSSVGHINALGFSAETWTEAFDVYLNSSEKNKAKPVRRLLLTLTNLLLKHPVEDTKLLLTKDATSIAVRAICKQHDLASIKPAIQTLECFVSRGLIRATDIFLSYNPNDSAAQIKGQDGITILSEQVKSSGFVQAQSSESVENFTLSVLEWVRYPDCAPAVGRFLPIFFASLAADWSRAAKSLNEGQPLWISPVKLALERHPDLLEVVENHLLPGLLRLSLADREAFSNTLPFNDITQARSGMHSVADIQLCLLTARISLDLGLDKGLGTFSESRFNNSNAKICNSIDENSARKGQAVLLDSESLGISLLSHASSSVRVSALSLLISSSISTKPFTGRCLDRLRSCMRYFHVEVNVKTRNEFIALMTKMLARIRGAIVSLLRSRQHQETPSIRQAPNEASTAAENDRLEQNSREESLEQHLEFRRWYMIFLVQELRPTANYQSHITALKILHTLLQGDIAMQASHLKSKMVYFTALNDFPPRGLLLRLIFDLISNPFDDVRQCATSILDIFFSLNSGLPSPDSYVEHIESQDLHRKRLCLLNNGEVHQVLLKAELRSQRTGRADHADGVGRLYDFLYGSSRALANPKAWYHSNITVVEHLVSSLEKETKMAKDDLMLAVSNAPLHGHLIALR